MQTEMCLPLVSAEKNLLHALENAKGKENGRPMVIETASKNVMQHHGTSIPPFSPAVAPVLGSCDRYIYCTVANRYSCKMW